MRRSPTVRPPAAVSTGSPRTRRPARRPGTLSTWRRPSGSGRFRQVPDPAGPLPPRFEGARASSDPRLRRAASMRTGKARARQPSRRPPGDGSPTGTPPCDSGPSTHILTTTGSASWVAANPIRLSVANRNWTGYRNDSRTIRTARRVDFTAKPSYRSSRGPGKSSGPRKRKPGDSVAVGSPVCSIPYGAGGGGCWCV